MSRNLAAFFFIFALSILSCFSKENQDAIELTGFYGFEFGASYNEILSAMEKKGFVPTKTSENESIFYEKIPFDNCPFGKTQDSEVTFNFENGVLVSGTAYFLMDLDGDEDHLVGPVLKIIGWYDDMYNFKKRKYVRENLKKEKLVLYTCTGTLNDGKTLVMKIYDYKDGRPRHASVTPCNFLVK